MKPKPKTIQWLAPHLSDGEVQAIYEAILSEVIGEDEFSDAGLLAGYWTKSEQTKRHRDLLRKEQHKELSRLFGKETE